MQVDTPVAGEGVAASLAEPNGPQPGPGRCVCGRAGGSRLPAGKVSRDRAGRRRGDWGGVGNSSPGAELQCSG